MKFLQFLFRLKNLAFLLCFWTTCFLPFNLFGACNCPASTDCAQQPTGPCTTPAGNQYILRYSIAGVHGAMTFIGNTLGLSKDSCVNLPGVNDSIGAFTTTNDSIAVPGWPTIPSNAIGGPAGTTLDWHQNSSLAVLNLPANSTILYAELIWSGSYGYFCSDPSEGTAFGVDPNCVLTPANGPITFITADGQSHQIISDPATRLISQNEADDVQDFYCGGNYLRSANVTALFSAPSLTNPNGNYIVGGIPATVSPFDETHNAAGWTLAIVYQDNSNPNINNMSLFVSNQQAQRPPPDEQFPPAEVTGFCAAPSSTIGQTARVLISAIETDANKSGDNFNFGPTALTMVPLTGPNNPLNNFFSSQINDDNGNLINTTGTFCTRNQNPGGSNISAGRQGYDITNVDASATILPNQTTAFAQGVTVGDDYMINALGIQINVNAPVIVPIKKVNGQNSVISNVGDTVTFTFTINNTGSGGASNVFFKDTLEPGLQLVPNTFKVNNVLVANPNLITGVPLGSIAHGDIVTIEFNVLITSRPAEGNIFHNFGTTPFDFIACNQQEPFHASNNSNVVIITLTENPPPTEFLGVVKKCKFLNKTQFRLRATFTPVPLPDVVAYLVFENGHLVETIPPSGPFVFETCLHSKRDAKNFTIVAVFPNNVVSIPLKIRIVHE